MKKTTILAICMAVLLVGATSGFAAPLWTALPDSTVRGDGDYTGQFWSGSTTDPLSIPSTTPLQLTLQFTATGLGSDNIFLVGGTKGLGSTGIGTTSESFAPLSGSGTLSFDVVHNPSGIYAFTAYILSNSYDTAAWTMTKATLDVKTATTPIPAAGLLLGSGLLGLFGIGKARRNKKAAPAA